jgi:hypothetical protein
MSSKRRQVRTLASALEAHEKTNQLIELMGFFLVAEARFELATFRL